GGPQQGGGRGARSQDFRIHRMVDVAWAVSVANSDAGAQIPVVSGVELGDVLSAGYLSFRVSTQSATQSAGSPGRVDRGSRRLTARTTKDSGVTRRRHSSGPLGARGPVRSPGYVMTQDSCEHGAS